LLELCKVGLIRTVNEEYLKIAEVAAWLKISPKTVKNKMAAHRFYNPVDSVNHMKSLPVFCRCARTVLVESK
jgi:hypothetical protein